METVVRAEQIIEAHGYLSDEQLLSELGLLRTQGVPGAGGALRTRPLA